MGRATHGQAASPVTRQRPGALVAHQHLGLHPGHTARRRKALDEVGEQILRAFISQDLSHALDLLCTPCDRGRLAIAQAADLRRADNLQQ